MKARRLLPLLALVGSLVTLGYSYLTFRLVQERSALLPVVDGQVEVVITSYRIIFDNLDRDDSQIAAMIGFEDANRNEYWYPATNLEWKQLFRSSRYSDEATLTIRDRLVTEVELAVVRPMYQTLGEQYREALDDIRLRFPVADDQTSLAVFSSFYWDGNTTTALMSGLGCFQTLDFSEEFCLNVENLEVRGSPGANSLIGEFSVTRACGELATVLAYVLHPNGARLSVWVPAAIEQLDPEYFMTPSGCFNRSS